MAEYPNVFVRGILYFLTHASLWTGQSALWQACPQYLVLLHRPHAESLGSNLPHLGLQQALSGVGIVSELDPDTLYFPGVVRDGTTFASSRTPFGSLFSLPVAMQSLSLSSEKTPATIETNGEVGVVLPRGFVTMWVASLTKVKEVPLPSEKNG
jgi:hypothetical protein